MLLGLQTPGAISSEASQIFNRQFLIKAKYYAKNLKNLG